MAKKKEATARSEAPATEAAQGMPMFFKRPAALDKARHAEAGIRQENDLSYAAGTNSIPLNTLEFIEAAKSYPIVFTLTDEPSPVAVVGWEQANYFVNAKNEWASDHYVPAYVRQYPFIFYQPPNSDQLILCVDEGASQFEMEASKKAAPLFKDGAQSDLTKRALEFCSSFFQHMTITKNFCADLQKHKLLAPYSSKVNVNGREMQLNGFLMIDEKAFNALSDDVILEFRKKGWLAFIYLAMASASNWKRLMGMAQSVQ